MGLRFRKSIKLLPGVRANFSLKGAGLSFGGKGLRCSVSSTGRGTASIGVPGTGISYSKTLGSSGGKRKSSGSAASPSGSAKPPKKPFYQRKWFIILLLVLFAPVGIFLLWKYWGDSGKAVKWGLSVLAGLIFVTALVPTGDTSDPGTLPDEPGSGISASLAGSSEEAEPSDEVSAEEAVSTAAGPTEDDAVSSGSSAASSETGSSAAASQPAESSTASSVTGDAASSTAPDGMTNVVYWGDSGTKYHIDPECRSFQGNTPNSGTIEQAKELGRTGWCGICSDGWSDARLEEDGNPHVK